MILSSIKIEYFIIIYSAKSYIVIFVVFKITNRGYLNPWILVVSKKYINKNGLTFIYETIT